MLYTPYVLPKIVLRGKPFEIGKQYGDLARDRIIIHAAKQRTAAAKLHPEEPEWWRSEVHKYLAPYEELAPYFVEEMEGLAQGAGLSFDEVLLVNVRDEFWASLRPETREACTSFGCSGKVTLSGHPVLGQTKDTGRVSQDLYVVIAMYQEGRPDLLQMPYAGEFGVFGLGSSGMAIFGNSIYVKGKAHGRIPISLFRRLTLEADSIDQVIALVDKHGLGTPGSFTIGDRKGRVIALENTDHGHAVVEANDGILAHANHINASQLMGYEEYPEPERTVSHNRQERMTEQLAAERGRLTPTLAMRCLMDHTNYPDSICRHPTPGHDFQTTAALVVEPTLGIMRVIRGLPCQGWAETYTL